MELTGISATMAALRKEVAAFERECVEETKRIARTLLDELMAITPVWEGETVRNYAAGVGRKPSGGTKSPAGGVAPGVTSAMALGSEPRRGPNEAAARADLASVLTFTKLASIVFTNHVDNAKWDLIENGSAPTGATSRSPGGVSMRATQATRSRHAQTAR